MEISAVLFVADTYDATGTILTVDALRSMADGKTRFFDEASKSLIYRGPMPREIPDA